ncbi:PDR/VanB family oxidoreductase [Hansschlegelia quercus]|uniref:Oxidoreductase n=1 Tax=Hansschlegelia quercus TaxID=2528245 RepID=A0A4Q9GPL8_9HYPH|nr:PDR/VanB family oxidoreductase [Hansschlegelia quercus]TBN53547.1 oxidoreductase [Hansschlegelia quercus]
MSARIIMKLKVEAAVATTPDIVRLSLVHPHRPTLPLWEPGAHVDLRLPDGRVRQYSLCSDPADLGRYEIAIKREDLGRGGSVWAHANLLEGSTAHVSHPRNNFPLQDDAIRHVFVAGGIGVTPFLAMAHSLAARRQEYELHLCARAPTHAPLLSELRAVCGDKLRCWYSSEARRFDPDVLPRPQAGVHIYACGPQSLMDSLQSDLKKKGWPLDQVHVEHFGALDDENFAPEPFDVLIKSTGRAVHIPAERSLLDVLREEGFRMSSSCGIGVCGACECGYSDGTVIHRDVVLASAKRHDRMIPCVSRAKGRLTLLL